ncbi:EmrB/QacA subfamily drug resistance transporter [Paenibacillus macerans]|uniref:Putative membrane protein n=1 Tax=Paenibacillus macerans TaxID=44252 RepID=A0A090ZD28_PAEMA|nr:putative membrane protein [Paenibacillus macerans]SUA83531.1 EmrB/QacA subfamily drug resistance transporter [Paenibacillus macerans]
MMVVAYFCLKNVGEIEKAKLDRRSILYSTLGFGGLLYGFSIVGEQGVSARLSCSIIAVGLIMVFLFVKRQFELAVPLLDFNVFRYPRFTYPSIIGVILYIVMAGAELLLPIYAQNVRGLMPRESGLLLFPGALLMGLFGWLSGLMAGMGFMLTPITAFAVASLPSPHKYVCSAYDDGDPFLGHVHGRGLADHHDDFYCRCQPGRFSCKYARRDSCSVLGANCGGCAWFFSYLLYSVCFSSAASTGEPPGIVLT